MKQVSPDQKIDAIEPARIEWRGSDPFSPVFNDVYFSRAGGLDETHYVFLQHNRLQQRFSDENQPFVIGETGFGTGLNFLCAWRLFLQSAPADRVLHFVSAEKFPLRKSDLVQAHEAWPELQPFSQELIALYPAPTPGFHRLILAGGRIHLTLLFGDAAQQFSQLNAKVDAWFLDGFSPSQNVELWQLSVMKQMQRLSKTGSTFATFTAASWVRKALQESGFHVEKAQGFGRKREMLYGKLESEFITEPLTSTELIAKSEPWFRFTAPARPSDAIVIGAGLAGAATAAALARRGIRVKVLEKQTPGCGASGNAQGVIFTKLSPYNTPQTRFYQQSYLYACRQVERVLGTPDGQRWDRCGMLQLAFDDDEKLRQEAVLNSGLWPDSIAQPMTAEHASAMAELALPSGGLFFPDSGWVNPPSLIAAYLDHPNIELISHCDVQALVAGENGDWIVETSLGQHLTRCLIIANSYAAKQFPLLEFLPLSRIRGQVTQIKPNTHSVSLKTPILYEGYCTPARSIDGVNSHCVGASFIPKSDDSSIKESENLSNLQLLKSYLQRDLFGADEVISARAAIRSQPTDYMPALGPVPDQAFFLEAYARLRTGNFRTPFPPGVYLPGLYLNLGHGSRGIATTALAAEYLACLISHEPWPLDQQLANFLNPARFLIRALKRRNR